MLKGDGGVGDGDDCENICSCWGYFGYVFMETKLEIRRQ